MEKSINKITHTASESEIVRQKRYDDMIKQDYKPKHPRAKSLEEFKKERSGLCGKQ